MEKYGVNMWLDLTGSEILWTKRYIEKKKHFFSSQINYSTFQERPWPMEEINLIGMECRRILQVSPKAVQVIYEMCLCHITVITSHLHYCNCLSNTEKHGAEPEAPEIRNTCTCKTHYSDHSFLDSTILRKPWHLYDRFAFLFHPASIVMLLYIHWFPRSGPVSNWLAEI